MTKTTKLTDALQLCSEACHAAGKAYGLQNTMATLADGEIEILPARTDAELTALLEQHRSETTDSLKRLRDLLNTMEL